MSRDRDMQIVVRMMGVTAISNVADCCVFYLAGYSGMFFKALIFLSGSWLYLGNVLIGYMWAKFLVTHMNIPFSDTRRRVYRGGGILACLLLIINLFYPLVFSNKDIGPFDDESKSVAIMDAYLEENGYENDLSDTRLHHEIYMSDARKVAPEKWKTVIRHPIKKAVE